MKSKLIIVLLLAGVSLWVLLPLFRTGFPVTDDGEWMVIRLSAFYQSLREGQFPVRFLGRLNNSYGYPVANFLYPGFMYIGSLIRLIGFPFTVTVKLLLGASVMAIAASCFLWLYPMFSRRAAASAALLSMMTPYLLFDLYKRGSVGEVLGIAVGMFALVCLERSWSGLFAACIGLLIVSHNTIAMFFLLLFIIRILYTGRLQLLAYAGLGVGLASFFWIPAIADQDAVSFSRVTVSNPFRYFAAGDSLYLISAAAVLLLVFLWVYGVRKKERSELGFWISLLAVALFFALPVSAPVWAWRSFERLVQFPFRFLVLTIPAAAFLTAYLTDTAFRKKTVADNIRPSRRRYTDRAVSGSGEIPA